MDKILIVVDMQNDFINGSLGTKEAQNIVSNVVKKIEEANKNNDTIIFTRDTHFNDYLRTNEGKKLPIEHCIKDTKGWEICNEIKKCISKMTNPILVDKFTFGYSKWDQLLFKLPKREDPYEQYNFELVGLCTDICVISNALILKALYPEANITVDSSCCAGVTPETHKAALETMKMCQIDII